MAEIRNINFEAIELIGDEKSMRKQTLGQHPSETFDYIPEIERITYNVSLQSNEEIEIVPYDVYKMELHKSKQPRFYGWTNLNVMRIHNCHLDEVYWEMFNGLENLHHLSLEHNDIKNIPPFAFYGALHIKTLSLAKNYLLDLNYRSLAGLLNLEKLDLTWNNLTKLSELTFPPFPRLEFADFRHNPIKNIFPMTFGIMNATKKLILGSETGALDLVPGSSPFTALEQLTQMILLNVSAPVLSQEMFKGLKSLEHLKIKGSVNRIEFDAFSEMPRMRELVLNNCGILEISMDAFVGVRNLKVIDLSNNKLFNIPTGVFEEQKQLREIYLHNNDLSELPKQFFERPSLKMVRLTGNPWICSCEMTSWRQAITNRKRGRPLSKKITNCFTNPKTGKLENCQKNDAGSNYPEWTYEFDNKLSPRCDGGPDEVKHRSVYYTLRHSVKCAKSTDSVKISQSKLSPRETEKQRLQTKYIVTIDKLNNSNKHLGMRREQNKVHQRLNLTKSHTSGDPKQIRRQAFENKFRKTLDQNIQKQKLDRQVVSNTIDLSSV